MKPTRVETTWRIAFVLMLLLNPVFLWVGVIRWPNTRLEAFCTIGLNVWGAVGFIAMGFLFLTPTGRRQFRYMWRMKYRAKESSGSSHTDSGNGGAD